MAEKNKHNYDESKIKTLSSLEHIRLRTGMYIGRIGNGNHYDHGCYILLKEDIATPIDEYIIGFGNEVQITIDDVCQVSVRLNGVGTKAVNALSDVFVVRSHRGGEFVEASFKRGKLKNEKKAKNPKETDGTYDE